MQISANLLQRNVNNLTIITTFVDGMNIRARRMNIQRANETEKEDEKGSERMRRKGVTKVKIFNTSGWSKRGKKHANFVCYM